MPSTTAQAIAVLLLLVLTECSFSASLLPPRRGPHETFIDPLLNLATHMLNGGLDQADENVHGHQRQIRQLQSLDLKLPDAKSSEGLLQQGGSFIRAHVPSGERLGDFLAGAAAGMVVVMVVLGVGFGCRQLVCRRSRRPLPLAAADVLIDEQEQQPVWEQGQEPLALPFTYSEREREIMEDVKTQAKIEAERKRNLSRKWWQRASEPKDIPSAPANQNHKIDRDNEGHGTTGFFVHLKWPWQHPGREDGAYHSPGLTVTRLTDSREEDRECSPPWKRRSVEV